MIGYPGDAVLVKENPHRGFTDQLFPDFVEAGTAPFLYRWRSGALIGFVRASLKSYLKIDSIMGPVAAGFIAHGPIG